MRVASALILISLFSAFAAADEPITIVGSQRATADMPTVPGVRTIEVFHATAGGWTYNHHVDLACWNGRLYLAWNSCEKDEDIWPSREMYATSEDGVHWSPPAELFPQGRSTALRVYFFHAPNGRMLAIAGLRTSNDTVAEMSKGGLVVREIRANHSLGAVYTLRGTATTYATSSDRSFVEACEQLLANKPFLEQQDYGRLLGERRMKWHDRSADFDRFGKMCFFHRKDNALVAVMKWGWVLASRDEGETWSSPVRPSTLVTGMAKVWGQRTPSGKYVLFYNPDPEKRYPLVMVHGENGITFGDMQIVNGDHPPLRFAGLNKLEGPQYVRGISEWSSDGSFHDDAIWIAYSMGKEDIYVSRVPSPGTRVASDAAK